MERVVLDVIYNGGVMCICSSCVQSFVDGSEFRNVPVLLASDP